LKILYLVSRVPYPINKGDKLRASLQLNSLMKSHEITLFATNDDYHLSIIEGKVNELCTRYSVQRLSKLNILINLVKGYFNKLPFQVAYFYSKKIKNKLILEIKSNKPDLIICQLIRMAEYVKDIKDIPKIIDYVDALSFGLERRISKEFFLMRLILKQEYRRVIKYEEELSKKFDAQMIITERDYNKINISDKKNLYIIPNGINNNYFESISLKKEFDLLFVGNMEYPPNEDAALFIINKILPILNEYKINIRFCIAGSSPTRKLLKYNSDQIIITGWIDDIRAIYFKSQIFIAPMRLGSGLQNKILQALAIGLPCITSNLAFEGLYSEAKDIVILAEEAKDYASKIIRLLNDNNYYDLLSEKGKEFAKKYYSMDKVEHDLFNVINSTIKS
jgi:glycosyltransferase involved in cell wall biosynthesis